MQRSAFRLYHAAPLLASLGLSALLALPAAAQTAKPAPTQKSTSAAPAKSTKAKAVKPAPANATSAAPTGGVPAEERARQMTTKMQSALGLSGQQAQKVQEINLRSIKRMEEARVKYIRDLRKMSQEVDNIGQSRLSLLKDVLTDQQFRTYNAMRAQKMGIPGESGGEGSGGAARSGIQVPEGAE